MSSSYLLLTLLIPVFIHSTHLDIADHCKNVTENGWVKYDCLSYTQPQSLSLDSPPTVKNVNIENVQNLSVSLDLVPDVLKLELRNISTLSVHSSPDSSVHSSPDSSVHSSPDSKIRLQKLTVFNSGEATIYLAEASDLEFLKVSDTRVQNVQFPPKVKELILRNAGIQSIQSLPGGRLTILDLSGNPISEFDFLEDTPKLTFLNLASTNLTKIPDFKLPALDKLNINDVRLTNITDGDFKNMPMLKELYASKLPKLEQVDPRAFDALVHLEKLVLSDNPRLDSLANVAFPKLLKYLKISGNALRLLPQGIMGLNLTHFSAEGNDIICDCRHYWLYRYSGAAPLTCGQGAYSGLNFVDSIQSENCSMVKLANSTSTLTVFINKNVTLSCAFTGNPPPSITWVTPRNIVYKWNSSDFGRLPEDKEDIHILGTGELYIPRVERTDVGKYTCIGSNSLSDLTTYVTLRLNPSAIYDMKIISILVGLATCVGFLLIVVIVLLVKIVVERCGWRCCCRKRESPRAKRVRTMLDNLEQYRSQQLERLRDNYQQQVQKIRENCAQQAERVRDTYQHRAQNVRDLKTYGSQHITSIRDQYNDQIKRVSDYSTDRLRRVRSNYVSQRERIGRFSAQQLFRLRESAKFQQRTLNKIIENLPSLYLDNCRHGGPGPRTDSIDFDDDFVDVDMYIQTTISHLSLEFDDFHRQALETINEEGGTADPLQANAEDETVVKQPRASRQGSGTSIDLSKFIPTRFTAAGSEARKNRRKKRKTQKNVSVTVEHCASEAEETLLPQAEAQQTTVEITNDVEETTERCEVEVCVPSAQGDSAV